MRNYWYVICKCCTHTLLLLPQISQEKMYCRFKLSKFLENLEIFHQFFSCFNMFEWNFWSIFVLTGVWWYKSNWAFRWWLEFRVTLSASSRIFSEWLVCQWSNYQCWWSTLIIWEWCALKTLNNLLYCLKQ